MSPHRRRKPPGPGEESVWDYPRPAVLRPVHKRIRVIFNTVTIADSQSAFRVLETSHPPTYYIPPSDVKMQHLKPSDRRSLCEWKGLAVYFTLQVGERVAPDAAWSYPEPTPAFEQIRDHLAFYPSRVDECYVGDDRVRAQSGDFYGGWITPGILGPFKGEPGTEFW